MHLRRTIGEQTGAHITVPIASSQLSPQFASSRLERAAASVHLDIHIRLTRELHPREATRALADLVIEASGGTLADDAALLVLDWYGDHGSPRHTTAGVERPSA